MPRLNVPTLIVASLAFCGLARSNTVEIDDLEDIGPDETAVTTRIIADVTVAISTSSGYPAHAHTYYPVVDPYAFWGADNVHNLPLHPENISGQRFIQAGGGFGNGNYVIFDFSRPVKAFGLTTIDLLEDASGAGSWVTLRAFDEAGSVVDEHTRLEPQGPSGLDLDWMVSSDQPVITQVWLMVELPGGWSGHGLDDLVLDVSELGDLDCDGTVGFGDINPFVLALLYASQYADQYPDCDIMLADINGDGWVDFSDITPFVRLLLQ